MCIHTQTTDYTTTVTSTHIYIPVFRPCVSFDSSRFVSLSCNKRHRPKVKKTGGLTSVSSFYNIIETGGIKRSALYVYIWLACSSLMTASQLEVQPQQQQQQQGAERTVWLPVKAHSSRQLGRQKKMSQPASQPAIAWKKEEGRTRRTMHLYKEEKRAYGRSYL